MKISGGVLPKKFKLNVFGENFFINSSKGQKLFLKGGCLLLHLTQENPIIPVRLIRYIKILELHYFFFFFSLKFKAAEFMQNLNPVGFGPSLKIWPRWPLHFLHRTSVLLINKLLSDFVFMLSLFSGL